MEAFLLTNVSSRRGVGNASSSHSTRRCRRSGGTWCRRHRPRQKVRPRWISTFSVRFVSHGRFRRKTHAVHWWLFYLATHATPSAEQDWILMYPSHPPYRPPLSCPGSSSLQNILGDCSTHKIGAGDKERSALCIMLHDAAARIGDHGRAMADAKEHFLGLRLGTTYTVEVYCPTEAVDLWHNYSIAWHSEAWHLLTMAGAGEVARRRVQGLSYRCYCQQTEELLLGRGGVGEALCPEARRPRYSSTATDGMVTSFSKTESQFSLSSMSLDMPGMDDYLQLQHDFIVCTVCAKHACATHPRSIAERERRTRISKRLLRRLQQLVTNMDKQKNTSDMLHIAVDYIKVSPTLRMSTPPSTPPASSGPLVSSRATSDQRAS